MTNLSEMTIDQIADELVGICEANPEQRNPRDDRGTCLNTSRINPDHHCLIAQFLVNHGVGLPAADSEGNQGDISDLIEDLGLWLTDQVADFLSFVQRTADGPRDAGTERWDDLPDVIRYAQQDAHDRMAWVS